MTFNEAALAASKAVSNAPLSLTIDKFYEYIPSLVVKTGENEYWAMTVKDWRESSNKPTVVLTIATGDAFGG